MKKEAYVFFDIDNTIYDYHKGVPDSTREAIRLLRENGHHPIICTGRSKIMISQGIFDLGFDGLICGAGTYIEKDGKVILDAELPMSEVRRIITLFQENGVASYPEGRDYCYYDQTVIDNGAGEVYRIYQRSIPDNLKVIDLSGEIHCAKISGYQDPPSALPVITEALGDDYEIVIHGGKLIETSPKGFSKGRAIKLFAEAFGADMEQTYAFGDSFNDYDMLTTVKYGVCMANGDEKLKSLCEYVCEAMMEDGVYLQLKRFGLI
ncbi:MAG: Cof-type HAD-IIB family hydrolase [Parasporobacterium sp.]|nr:Cof-type HAD-IIB family hydrolase [Parasporobacterium sp.]